MFVIAGTALAYSMHNPAYIFFGALIDYVIVFRSHDSVILAINHLKQKLKNRK